MRNLTPKYDRRNFQLCVQRQDSYETCGCLRLETEGVVFKSPWRLELMADVMMRVECIGGECRCQTLTVGGIVIGCEDCGAGYFEVTVLFLQDEDFDLDRSVKCAPAAAHLLN